MRRWSDVSSNGKTKTLGHLANRRGGGGGKAAGGAGGAGGKSKGSGGGGEAKTSGAGGAVKRAVSKGVSSAAGGRLRSSGDKPVRRLFICSSVHLFICSSFSLLYIYWINPYVVCSSVRLFIFSSFSLLFELDSNSNCSIPPNDVSSTFSSIFSG